MRAAGDFLRLPALLLLAAQLVSCTALRVVTHETDVNPVNAPAGTYRLDPRHWSVSFDVEHLGYARFVMRFDRVRATLDAVPAAPEKSRVTASSEAASIDTNVPELDRLVAGPDMLDAARHPEIRFESRNIRRTGARTGEMTGDLTIGGRTRPVTLAVTFNGSAPNPLTGADVLGFSAQGRLDRSAWGLNAWWPAVGNEVRVRIEAEFVRPRNLRGQGDIPD